MDTAGLHGTRSILPVPRETPMLSSLIKWQHRQQWHVPKPHGNSQGSKRGRASITRNMVAYFATSNTLPPPRPTTVEKS